MSILEAPAPPADFRLRYGPDPLHFGDLRLPIGAGPHPVVVAVHGGFWRARYDLEHLGHLCSALTEAGIATWSVEYRRVGNAGGGWPNTFLDVAHAADALRDLAAPYNLDLSRVITLGHSAGGHLALWLAARHRLAVGDPLYTPDPLPLRGVVSLAGVADLRHAWELALSRNAAEELLGGSPTHLPQRYATASPIEMLPLHVPQHLIHGADDDLVPLSISQRYHDAAHAAGDVVTLTTLPNTGHFEPIAPHSHAWPKVLAAVQSVLLR